MAAAQLSIKRLNYRKAHFVAYSVTCLRLNLSLSIHLLSHHSGLKLSSIKNPTHLKVLMVQSFEDITEKRPITARPSCQLSLYLKAGHRHSAVHSGCLCRHAMHFGSRTVHCDKILILHRFLYSDKNCCSLATLAPLQLVSDRVHNEKQEIYNLLHTLMKCSCHPRIKVILVFPKC